MFTCTGSIFERREYGTVLFDDDSYPYDDVPMDGLKDILRNVGHCLVERDWRDGRSCLGYRGRWYLHFHYDGCGSTMSRGAMSDERTYSGPPQDQNHECSERRGEQDSRLQWLRSDWRRGLRFGSELRACDRRRSRFRYFGLGYTCSGFRDRGSRRCCGLPAQPGHEFGHVRAILRAGAQAARDDLAESR